MVTMHVIPEDIVSPPDEVKRICRKYGTLYDGSSTTMDEMTNTEEQKHLFM